MCAVGIAVIGLEHDDLVACEIRKPMPKMRRRMGHDQPLGSMYDEGHQMFKKLVEERSQGKIRVDVFPAAQLGSEVAMVEGVRLGSIDVICANSPNAATRRRIFSVNMSAAGLPPSLAGSRQRPTNPRSVHSPDSPARSSNPSAPDLV